MCTSKSTLFNGMNLRHTITVNTKLPVRVFESHGEVWVS